MTQEKLEQPSMYCRQCGYALVGLSEDRCPECGRAFDPADSGAFLRYPPGYKCRQSIEQFRQSVRKSMRAVAQLALIWACIAAPSSIWLYWRYYTGWQAEQPAIAALKASSSDLAVRTTPSRRDDWGLLHRIVVPLDYLRGRVRFISAEGPARSPVNLAGLGALRHCTSIWLGNLGITDDQLKCLEGMTQLTGLFLAGNPGITDQGLVHLKGLTSLTDLDLTGTCVSGKGLRVLQGLPHLSGLDLADTDVRGKDLAELKSFHSLHSLLLDDLPITDADLVHLKQLPLTHIYLHGTRITDAGLAEIGQMVKLETLRLSATTITDAALTQLSGLKGLKWLDFDKTAVTDAGLQYLKGLPNLQVLSVKGTKVTSEGIRQCKQAIPSLYTEGP